MKDEMDRLAEAQRIAGESGPVAERRARIAALQDAAAPGFRFMYGDLLSSLLHDEVA